jgi:hypothetical protein
MVNSLAVILHISKRTPANLNKVERNLNVQYPTQTPYFTAISFATLLQT